MASQLLKSALVLIGIFISIIPILIKGGMIPDETFTNEFIENSTVNYFTVTEDVREESDSSESSESKNETTERTPNYEITAIEKTVIGLAIFSVCACTFYFVFNSENGYIHPIIENYRRRRLRSPRNTAASRERIPTGTSRFNFRIPPCTCVEEEP